MICGRDDDVEMEPISKFSYGRFGGGRGPHVGAVCNGSSDRCCTRPLPVYGQPSEAFLRRNRGSFYADQFLKRYRALQLVAGVTDLKAVGFGGHSGRRRSEDLCLA